MTEETDIPLPVRFNPFKHHRNYIMKILESASPELIINLLDPVCNNYIDIYSGTMTPEAIGNAVIDLLKSNQVFQANDFARWVDSKTAYLLKTGYTGLQEILSLENVNRARRQIGLSPVKKLDRSKGILNCFEKFFSPD